MKKPIAADLLNQKRAEPPAFKKTVTDLREFQSVLEKLRAEERSLKKQMLSANDYLSVLQTEMKKLRQGIIEKASQNVEKPAQQPQQPENTPTLSPTEMFLRTHGNLLIQGAKGVKGDKGDTGESGSPDTAAQVLAKLITVDGADSGVDADLLDGQHGSYYQPKDADLTAIAALTDTGGYAKRTADNTWSIATPTASDIGAVATSVLTDIKEPTGFLDVEDIGISYDENTRKITLTGTLAYYWRGTKHTLTSPWTSPTAHDTGDGRFYLYSTDGTNFTWSDQPWVFSDLQVAYVSVAQSGAVIIGFRELHGVMPYEVHHVLHHTMGAYIEEGGTLDGNTYTVNTASDVATTPGVLAAELHDEDNEVEIAAWTQGTYTTMRIGASSVATFDTTASFPFRAGASYIYINNPTDGSEAATVNNRYVNVYGIYMPTTDDVNSQKYRLVWLQPQTAFTTLVAAQAENPSGLSFGDFSSIAAEFAIRIRITYVTASGDTNTGKCRIATNGVSYLTGGRYNALSVAGVAAVTAATVPITTISGMDATTVQEALEELNAVPLELQPEYTKVTVPTASSYHYGLIVVTDATGGPALCMSVPDGLGGWKWCMVNFATDLA